MTKPNLAHLVLVLDRSGSMESIKHDMQGGIDNFLREQRAQPGECRVTLARFDAGAGRMALDIVADNVAIADAPSFALEPRGSTPLLDAVGTMINRVGKTFADMPEDERPSRVLFMIITDGYENASHEFSRTQIRDMIKTQTEQFGWAFSFLGANLDAFAEASTLGIMREASANFVADGAGVAAMFSSVSRGASAYRGGADYSVTNTDTRVKQ